MSAANLIEQSKTTPIQLSGKEQESKSKPQIVKVQVPNRQVSELNPVMQQYLNDSNPPLIRYIKEGKAITRRLKELKKEYEGELRQKLRALKKCARKTGKTDAELAVAEHELLQKQPTLELYKQKIKALEKLASSEMGKEFVTAMDELKKNEFVTAMDELKKQYPSAEAYRQKVKELYKNVKPTEINRECAFAYQEEENGIVRYGAAVFKRDGPKEVVNKNIKNTALARYYFRPVFVQLSDDYKTMSESQKLLFIRNRLHAYGTKGEDQVADNYKTMSQSEKSAFIKQRLQTQETKLAEKVSEKLKFAKQGLHAAIKQHLQIQGTEIAEADKATKVEC